MIAIVLLGRFLLCAVFLVAGLSKLRDRAGSRQSLIDFGLLEVLAKPFGLMLPIAEVVVAIGLLPASFAWISAVGALALLVLFIVGLAVALARGRKPDCHCFGQLHSKPIGWDLVGRNIALAIIPALVIYAGPRQPGFVDWVNASSRSSGGSVFFILGFAALALLLFQSWLIFQLVQQGGRVLLRLDGLEKQLGGNPAAAEPLPRQGLPVGDAAPHFELPDLAGSSVSLEHLRRTGKPVLLLFTHPGCGPCTSLLPEVAAWQRDMAAHFNLAVISQGTSDENRAKVKEHAIRPVLLQRDHEVSDQFDASSTPSAVLVLPNGTIGSLVATGAESIRSLVSSTINESLASLVSIELGEGATAPPLVYPDLDGHMFKISQLRGQPAIVLFWNPGCGYCQHMIEELKMWETKAAKADTQVIVISTGTVEANRKHGFRSRILLDQNFTAGKAFGASGTPSAILLDEQGKIASKVVVGKEDILDSIFGAQVAVRSRA